MSPTIGFPLFAVRSGLFPLKREEGSRGRESWGAGGMGGQSEVIIIKSCVISKEKLELYILYFKCGDAGRVDIDIGCIIHDKKNIAIKNVCKLASAFLLL